MKIALFLEETPRSIGFEVQNIKRCAAMAKICFIWFTWKCTVQEGKSNSEHNFFLLMQGFSALQCCT